MTIPVGSIIMFHGAIADSPTDFNLCDGGVHDGYTTPNLVDQFVYGANVDGDVDARGGASTHTHSSSGTGNSSSHTHDTYIQAVGEIAKRQDIHDGFKTAAAGGSHFHSGSKNSSSSGVHSHTIADTASGSSLPLYIKAFYIMNTANAAIEFGDLPVGAIVAWSSASIPTSWQLADGTNSTLDLRDRFVYGATADGDVGDTGGANTHTHTSAETASDGAHSHTASFGTGDTSFSGAISREEGSTYTVAMTNHSHTFSIGLSSGNAHTHTLSALDSDTNLPRYIKLYFIEKTA
jgi:hypothetical protein